MTKRTEDEEEFRESIRARLEAALRDDRKTKETKQSMFKM